MAPSRRAVDFDENIFGYGRQATAGNAIGDDFTITDAAGWHIDSITFFAYQTGGPLNGAISINADILPFVPVFPVLGTYSGGPGVFSGIYRAAETSPDSSARAINIITVVVNADFAAGTHWLVWEAIGDAGFSGPWQPPVSYPDAVNGPNPLGQAPNGMQFTGLWNPVEDSGSLTPDEFPFIVNGSVIPVPGSIALLLVAVGLRRSRRR